MIVDVNPFLITLLGYSRDEFIQKKLWEVGAFTDMDASKEAFQILQEKEYIRYENLPLKAKDGRLKQVEFVSNVYLVGQEKVIQCNIHDNTDRIRAEREIVSLAKFPSENPNPVLRLSLDGTVLFANQASSLLMKMWKCAVGSTAPPFWRELATQAIADRKVRLKKLNALGRYMR
jgi:PAS domain S-box-containing protein